MRWGQTRQSRRLCQPNQLVYVTDVLIVHEIRAIQDVMDGFDTSCVGPFAEFLGKATVVGVRAITIREALCSHEIRHAPLHRRQVHAPAREQRVERLPVRRRVRMQRKKHPPHLDIELFPKPVNTPGTEVAPRSYVVREHLENDWISHHDVSVIWVEARLRRNAP